MKLRHVFYGILAAAAVYLLWLTAGIVSYRQHEVPDAGSAQWELEGAYHIHTTLSDGFKDPEAVARIAVRSSLDFIILTDHGNPNREGHRVEGWRNGVLVLAGSELSTNRGHLVALGYRLPDGRFSSSAENASRQIRQLGGFTVIAHPYSKTHWTWGDPLSADGMEIFNADSMLKRNVMRWLPYLPAALVSPRFFILKTLAFPEQNIRKWNELSLQNQFCAYFSTDAHTFYGTLFDYLRIHVLLNEPLSAEFEKARQQVLASLKEGRFYNAVEAAAEADGFRFWAEIGGEKVLMGSRKEAGEQMTLHVQTPFPFAAETLLLLDGRVVGRSAEPEMTYPAERAGTYRVEVYLTERSPLSNRTPWIVSNPVFIAEKRP